ncbi:hydrogenase expression/formation protein [Frigidibacter sp. MR17.14]|uniref:hydrogenase expression/formation protein n=1 Tax=Frigidibacter sp. MR17.14 TaxID=3126509 RepID=UPI003012F573
MVSNFHLPPTGFGPGSQPDEGEALEYMALPSGMRTYSAHLPDVADSGALAPALAVLAEAGRAAARVAAGGGAESLDLAGLDAANLGLVAETLQQGEVSLKMRGRPALAAQESVFAGVWVVSGAGVNRLEIAAIPQAALQRAHAAEVPALLTLAKRGPGVVNAPALLAELIEQSGRHQPGGVPHVVNLTLLPHTPEDLDWLEAALGRGAVTILSRGYGNCRVTATALAHVWRVQFFNSMDVLILDTYEVTDMPEVALAATEDLADSAERIAEVLEAIR